MQFILGTIFGVIISLLLFVIEIWQSKNKGILTVIHRKAEENFKPKGAIIEAKTLQQEGIEKIIKENSDIGEDTKLDEII